ncbi:MAG: hypothetical protein V1799_07630 [bacterium]
MQMLKERYREARLFLLQKLVDFACYRAIAILNRYAKRHVVVPISTLMLLRGDEIYVKEMRKNEISGSFGDKDSRRIITLWFCSLEFDDLVKLINVVEIDIDHVELRRES